MYLSIYVYVGMIVYGMSVWLSDREVVSKYKTEIHCGVVGNIQAFHVCAPGSIPGDGVFLKVKKGQA